MSIYICSVCKKPPKNVRIRKDGEEAIPARWRVSADGVFCRDCKTTPKTANIVWRACQPVACLAEYEDQVAASHRYYNALLGVEKDRRARNDTILHRRWPRLAELDAAITEAYTRLDEARDAIKAKRAEARKRVRDPLGTTRVASIKHEIDTLKAERSDLRDRIADDPQTQAELAASAEIKEADIKRLRKKCGVYFGTYLMTEASAKQASGAAKLKFRRWPKDGTQPPSAIVGCQIQGGVTAADVLAGDSLYLRITCGDHESTGHGKRRCTCFLRINSDEHGNPIWATIPCQMDRPLPPGCRIKTAHLARQELRRSLQPPFRQRFEYRLILTVDLAGKLHNDMAESGTVGVDLGWWATPDGIRVACWSGSNPVERLNPAMRWLSDDGLEGEVVLPRSLVEMKLHAEEIHGTQDDRFNEARDRLADWLAVHPHPGWLKEMTANLRLWRSRRRLLRVVALWRSQRFDGDEAIFAALCGESVAQPDGSCVRTGWLSQEDHLDRYRKGLLGQIEGRRLEVYRLFVAALLRSHATAHIEDINWKKAFQDKPKPEENKDDAAARHHARLAAVGTLAQMVKQSWPDAPRIDPKHTTKRCHECGELCSFDAKTQRMHTCEHCGTRFDQDLNAARNLRDASAEVVDETAVAAR